jgi:hypothetical protein
MATLTTPRLAIPYPDGNERVRDGDNAIGALGAYLEDLTKAGIPARIATGSGTLPSSGTASSNVTVTFPAGRFSVAPQFVGVTMGASSAAYTMFGIGALSAASFNAIGGTNTGTGTCPALGFYWFAVTV